ncbi:hypothetical protein [Janthinobacterium psychrotolerans]|uniref:Cytochrome c n=1 Tax=Janthinobacterium psychrotolerans TaxID=1747903 RepID=A0A1A7C151_9BURK|nr:Cytochrome c [Janthinobacterium psychrotolerans]
MKHKRTLLWGGALLAAAATAAAACMLEPAITPIATPAASQFASQAVARGARVVAQGDCMVCHTAKGGASFAGGLPLGTPLGTIYTTNITPDAASGIGSWPLAAFTRALRRGVSRDGHLLYPAFPYIHYTRMSNQDIEDAHAGHRRGAAQPADLHARLPSATGRLEPAVPAPWLVGRRWRPAAGRRWY